MLEAFLILAQEAPKKTQESPLGGFFLLIPLIIALYFIIVILPGKRRQDKERMSLINNMKKNDEVLTIGGIYGTVVSVSENKDEVVVKVDDGTRLRMTKNSILRNITGEEAAKAAREQPKDQSIMKK
jgi:preprotein translocase subunit YajC